MIRIRRAATPGAWQDVCLATPALPRFAAPTPNVHDSAFYNEPLPLPPRWSPPELPGYNKFVLPTWGMSRWGFGHVLLTADAYAALAPSAVETTLLEVELDAELPSQSAVTLLMVAHRTYNVADWREPGYPGDKEDERLLVLELLDLRFWFAASVVDSTSFAAPATWLTIRDTLNATLPSGYALAGLWPSVGILGAILSPGAMSGRSAACIADALVTQACYRLRYDFATGICTGVDRQNGAYASWWENTAARALHSGGEQELSRFASAAGGPVRLRTWAADTGATAAAALPFPSTPRFVVAEVPAGATLSPYSGPNQKTDTDFIWDSHNATLIGYEAQDPYGHTDVVVYDHDAGQTRLYSGPVMYPLPLLGAGSAGWLETRNGANRVKLPTTAIVANTATGVQFTSGTGQEAGLAAIPASRTQQGVVTDDPLLQEFGGLKHSATPAAEAASSFNFPRPSGWQAASPALTATQAFTADPTAETATWEGRTDTTRPGSIAASRVEAWQRSRTHLEMPDGTVRRSEVGQTTGYAVTTEGTIPTRPATPAALCATYGATKTDDDGDYSRAWYVATAGVQAAAFTLGTGVTGAFDPVTMGIPPVISGGVSERAAVQLLSTWNPDTPPFVGFATGRRSAVYVRTTNASGLFAQAAEFYVEDPNSSYYVRVPAARVSNDLVLDNCLRYGVARWVGAGGDVMGIDHDFEPGQVPIVRGGLIVGYRNVTGGDYGTVTGETLTPLSCLSTWPGGSPAVPPVPPPPMPPPVPPETPLPDFEPEEPELGDSLTIFVEVYEAATPVSPSPTPLAGRSISCPDATGGPFVTDEDGKASFSVPAGSFPDTTTVTLAGSGGSVTYGVGWEPPGALGSFSSGYVATLRVDGGSIRLVFAIADVSTEDAPPPPPPDPEPEPEPEP